MPSRLFLVGAARRTHRGMYEGALTWARCGDANSLTHLVAVCGKLMLVPRHVPDVHVFLLYVSLPPVNSLCTYSGLHSIRSGFRGVELTCVHRMLALTSVPGVRTHIFDIPVSINLGRFCMCATVLANKRKLERDQMRTRRTRQGGTPADESTGGDQSSRAAPAADAISSERSPETRSDRKAVSQNKLRIRPYEKVPYRQ